MLATEATAMVHGREAADAGRRDGAQDLRGRRAAPRACRPSRSRRASLEAGQGLLSLLVTAGLAASNGEARRHVQGDAVRLNDEPVKDDRRIVGLADLGPEGLIKLSVGRKKHVLVRPV